MQQNVISDILERLAAVEARTYNLLLWATVSAVDEKNDWLTVMAGNLELEEIPYLTQRAGVGKTYWMPSVGERGLLLVPSGDVGNAVFMPAITTEKNPAPEKDEKVMIREFKPGFQEKFDGNDNEHMLSIGSNVTRKTTETEIEDKVGGTTRKTEATAIEDTAGAAKITIAAATGIITLRGTVVEVTAPVFKWNGVPTTPNAWILP